MPQSEPGSRSGANAVPGAINKVSMPHCSVQQWTSRPLHDPRVLNVNTLNQCTQHISCLLLRIKSRRSSISSRPIYYLVSTDEFDMKSLSLLFPLIFASSVLAHGFVDVLTLGSQAYQGQEPTEDGQPNNASVIRRISKIDPVKGATNPDVNCGNSAEAVSSNANANPGDKVLFKWIAGGGENVSFARTFITAGRISEYRCFWFRSGHTTQVRC